MRHASDHERLADEGQSQHRLSSRFAYIPHKKEWHRSATFVKTIHTRCITLAQAGARLKGDARSSSVSGKNTTSIVWAAMYSAEPFAFDG